MKDRAYFVLSHSSQKWPNRKAFTNTMVYAHENDELMSKKHRVLVKDVKEGER